MKIYHLMYGIILKSCLKLITYLVSKTWMLILVKISSKFFFGRVVYEVQWVGYLLVIDWLTISSKPTQFEWSGPFRSMGACDVESLPYNSLIVWIKESRICYSICKLVVIFAFTNSHFLRICCFVLGYVWWQQLH